MMVEGCGAFDWEVVTDDWRSEGLSGGHGPHRGPSAILLLLNYTLTH
jgi:hypothetical protein